MSLEIQCPHCHDVFSIPESLKGGVANCPKCRKIVEIKGDVEWVYWSLIALGAIGVLGCSGGLAFLSPWAGAGMLVVGTLVLVIIVLVS